jgi:4-diphosphocytidyl-2-C-methyl-D-erythritol kinase
MIRFPNCKINLGLYVTNKRADGYHDLETVFYPLQVCDALEMVPATEASLHMSGLPVQGDEKNNLVWKAWQLLNEKFPGKLSPQAIYLLKTIPMGAGLGGGSSDGAFALSMLNDIGKLGLNKGQLAEMALQLGSDCPFFIYNSPQFATGRGEQMHPISVNLSAYSIQLICPEVHVSTAAAFAMMQPKPATFHLKQLPDLPIKDWKDQVINDFEMPVFAQHPELQSIKQQLYNQGAIYASMSGSGSAIYGIFEKEKKAQINAEVGFKEFYVQ